MNVVRFVPPSRTVIFVRQHAAVYVKEAEMLGQLCKASISNARALWQTPSAAIHEANARAYATAAARLADMALVVCGKGETNPDE